MDVDIINQLLDSAETDLQPDQSLPDEPLIESNNLNIEPNVELTKEGDIEIEAGDADWEGDEEEGEGYEEDDTIYCLCKQPWGGKCMIQCDKCDIWYHAECVGIKESVAKKLDSYVCTECDVESEEEDEDEDDDDGFGKRKTKLKKEKPKTKLHKSPRAKPGPKPKPKKEKPLSKKEEKKRAMKVMERERPLPYSTSKKIVAIPVDQKASNAPIFPILNTELIVDVIQDMESNELFDKIIQEKCVRCEIKKPKFGSKYCSHECGLEYAIEKVEKQKTEEKQAYQKKVQLNLTLARTNILETISKDEEGGNPVSAMETEDIDSLNALEEERNHLIASKEDINKQKEELDLFLKNRFQYSLADAENESKGRKGSKKDADYFDCFGCGKSIVLLNYPAHSLTCFHKIESEVVTGLYKTELEQGCQIVHCDYYDRSSKVYCKKLKASCARHCPYGKRNKKEVGEPEVCACPLDGGNFCTLAHNKCQKHQDWENIKQSSILLAETSLGESEKAVNSEEKRILERMFKRRGLENEFQQIVRQDLPAITVFETAATKVAPLMSQQVAPEGYYDDMGLKLITPTKKIIHPPTEKKKKPPKEIEPAYSPPPAKNVSVAKSRKVDRSLEDSGNYYYSSTRSESRALAAVTTTSSPPRYSSPPRATPAPKQKKTKTPKQTPTTPTTPSLKAAQSLPPQSPTMPSYPPHMSTAQQQYYMPQYYTPPSMYGYPSPYQQAYPSPYATPYPYPQYPTYSMPLPPKESTNVPKMVQSAYTNPYTYYSYPSTSMTQSSSSMPSSSNPSLSSLPPSSSFPQQSAIQNNQSTASSYNEMPIEILESPPSNVSQPP